YGSPLGTVGANRPSARDTTMYRENVARSLALLAVAILGVAVGVGHSFAQKGTPRPSGGSSPAQHSGYPYYTCYGFCPPPAASPPLPRLLPPPLPHLLWLLPDSLPHLLRLLPDSLPHLLWLLPDSLPHLLRLLPLREHRLHQFRRTRPGGFVRVLARYG